MEEKITQIAQNTVQQNLSQSQFGFSPIAFHTHNNIDSPAISAQYIIFTNFMTWGKLALSGTSGTIKNPRIVTTSIIFVTSRSTPVAGNPSTSTVSGTCALGVATIRSNTTNDTLNYLIIF